MRKTAEKIFRYSSIEFVIDNDEKFLLANPHIDVSEPLLYPICTTDWFELEINAIYAGQIL